MNVTIWVETVLHSPRWDKEVWGVVGGCFWVAVLMYLPLPGCVWKWICRGTVAWSSQEVQGGAQVTHWLGVWVHPPSVLVKYIPAWAGSWIWTCLEVGVKKALFLGLFLACAQPQLHPEAAANLVKWGFPEHVLPVQTPVSVSQLLRTSVLLVTF